MIRNVDLVSYLPPFMAEFQEVRAALRAEEPEFMLVWQAADRALKNEFIATADEYGIARFERLLHVFPSPEDTLESRRVRVQARWFASLPYTWRMLLERLTAILGEDAFAISKDFERYRIGLRVQLDAFGQAAELDRLLEIMLPANMTIDSRNTLPCLAEGRLELAGGVCAAEMFFVTNDAKETLSVSGSANANGGTLHTARVVLTNDFNAVFRIPGSAPAGGGTVNAEIIEIQNDMGGGKNGWLSFPS